MAKIYAILGDIHANIDALETVLADAREQGVTDYVSVGDVVGYNAAPAECIRIVRDELKCPVVRGNHDHYVAYVEESLADFHPMAAAVVEWTRIQLSADDLKWLHDLPLSRPVMGFTIVHSTLDMPLRWGYVFENLQAEATSSISARRSASTATRTCPSSTRSVRTACCTTSRPISRWNWASVCSSMSAA